MVHLPCLLGIEVPGGVVKGAAGYQSNPVSGDAVQHTVPALKPVTMCLQLVIHGGAVDEFVHASLAEPCAKQDVLGITAALFTQGYQRVEMGLDKRSRCYAKMRSRVITAIDIFNGSQRGVVGLAQTLDTALPPSQPHASGLQGLLESMCWGAASSVRLD